MPADLDLLGAFTDAITGEQVQLPTTRGTLVVPKSEFEMALHELTELRAAQALEDEGADYARNIVEGLVDLVQLAQDQQASAVPVEMLSELLAPPEQDEPEQDPAMVEAVTGLLRSLGVEATAETGTQFLSILGQVSQNGHAPGPGRHRAPEPEEDEEEEEEEPQQLFQSVQRPVQRPAMLRPRTQAPAPRRIPQSKAHPILPATGIPIPANPRPHTPITAEQLFGLRRSASGRYDSGSIEQD